MDGSSVSELDISQDAFRIEVLLEECAGCRIPHEVDDQAVIEACSSELLDEP